MHLELAHLTRYRGTTPRSERISARTAWNTIEVDITEIGKDDLEPGAVIHGCELRFLDGDYWYPLGHLPPVNEEWARNLRKADFFDPTIISRETYLAVGPDQFHNLVGRYPRLIIPVDGPVYQPGHAVDGDETTAIARRFGRYCEENMRSCRGRVWLRMECPAIGWTVRSPLQAGGRWRVELEPYVLVPKGARPDHPCHLLPYDFEEAAAMLSEVSPTPPTDLKGLVDKATIFQQADRSGFVARSLLGFATAISFSEFDDSYEPFRTSVKHPGISDVRVLKALASGPSADLTDAAYEQMHAILSNSDLSTYSETDRYKIERVVSDWESRPVNIAPKFDVGGALL